MMMCGLPAKRKVRSRETISRIVLPRIRFAATTSPALLVLGVAVLATAAVQAGQVIVDHSFGPGGPLTGPNYTIPDTVGKTVGHNLFHSFSQFDLNNGDVATFSGPAGIQNVISRVTGGSASTIDGTLCCTIAGANFFLINPFGVMFGPNAKVDVSGSFAVTTADYVKLADGGRFDARNPASDLLTTAPVSAFGFLGPTAAAVVMQGPNADTPTPVLATLADGKSFFAVGGDIRLDNVELDAPSGRIALIGVSSAGEVGVNVDNLQSSIDVSSFTRLGDMHLTTFAALDVSGDPGGRIDIQGENLTIAASSLSASSLGPQDGLGIDLTVRDAITLRGGTTVYCDTLDVGAAGGLFMTAKSIRLLGDVYSGAGGVNVLTDTYGSGRAGDITMHTDTLLLQDGVAVTAETAGPGDGGSIRISAKSIIMEGQQSIASLSTTSFEGQPGDINIETDSLTLKSDAHITAEAFGSSAAGSIRISAKQIMINDVGGVGGGYAGISVNSDTLGFTTGQRAGDIVFNAETVDLRHGGRISSSSATESPGGDITIDAAREVRLSDSEIATQAGGDGGDVHLTAPSLVYLLNSQISAESVNGNGGNITIDPQFVILNGSSLIASAIQGNGGSVNIVSDYFLRSSAVIDVSSEFGLRGSVSITAPDVDLSGSLIGLTAELLGAETSLSPHCAQRLPGGVSSFIVLDRGGVPTDPSMLLPAVQDVSDSRKKQAH